MTSLTSVAHPFLVGIAGGSASGKTTLARGLVEALGRERTALLSHDAYYRDQSELAPGNRDAIDYDVPDAFDQALFVEHLRRLRRGESVRPPRYCFLTHRRTGDDDAVAPRDIVLVEGIVLFHDPDVRTILDLRLFVDAPSRLRFDRRIARDTTERGRTEDSVVRQYTTSVSAAHARYVEPTKAMAHLILLNTSRAEPIVEVAATVIRVHLARRDEEPPGAGVQCG